LVKHRATLFGLCSDDAINIRPMSSADGKRMRNNFPCYYCGKYIFEFARHLYQCHADEKEVMSVKFKSASKRKAMFDYLRNRATFRHNTKVLNRGSGELIVRRRSKRERLQRKAKDYLPCPYCLEFLVTDELWRHCQRCPLNPASKDSAESARNDDSAVVPTKKERGLIAASRILLEGACSSNIACSAEFRDQILSRLRRDYISTVIRSDNLILQFGESLFRKLGVHGATNICQRMRQLGRFLVTANSLHNQCLHLTSYIDGRHFEDVLTATENLSGAMSDQHGRSSFSTPSFGLKLGHALVKCAHLKKREAIIMANVAMEREADRFIALHKSDWLDVISSRSSYALRMKQQNKPKTLPLTEDLLRLKHYLDTNIDIAIRSVSVEYTYGLWRFLLELTLASIVVFNKRRGGEASRMLVTCYVNRPNWSQHGSGEIMKTFTPVEQKLLKRLLAVFSV
jgi:hypothetical protein